LLEGSQFHSLDWRHAAAAGNAVLAGKIFWHELVLLAAGRAVPTFAQKTRKDGAPAFFLMSDS
jgi:hypothetical protein